MWYVQFRHPYFGWLTLDETPYATKEAAERAAREQPKCYKRRVIFLPEYVARGADQCS